MKNKFLNTDIKSILHSVFCISLVVLIISCNPDEEQKISTKFERLTFSDDFNTDGPLNSDLWTYDIGTGINGWGNNELQYYTDRPENVVVEDGLLKITAIQEAFEGSNYTSARILTKGIFDQKHGRFEARMKLPFGKGMWPAFWLLSSEIDNIGWPLCGEIDIMENGGSRPTTVSGAVHGPGYSGGDAISKEYQFTNSRVDTEFHLYGIEWTPDFINYYIDDVLYFTLTPDQLEEEDDLDSSDWVYNNSSFFMILNLAVGGNFDGNPTEATVFPQTMYVDYVKVYTSY